MGKLKLRFLLYFSLLATIYGIFIITALQYVRTEEMRLWENVAEQSFNQMQARISDFLSLEDARPLNDYAPSAGNDAPLAESPADDPRGMIGYFEILSDGRFSTPHKDTAGSAGDHNLKARLAKLTSGLIADLKSPPPPALKPTDGKDVQAIPPDGRLKHEKIAAPEPNAGEKESADGKGDIGIDFADAKTNALYRQQMYPNPLLKQKKISAPKPAPMPEEMARDDKSTKGMDGDFHATGILSASSAGGAAAYKPVTPPVKDSATPSLSIPPRSMDIIADDGAENRNVAVPVREFAVKERRKNGENLLVQPWIDPFRARLAPDNHLIFYRKIWAGREMRLQGFAVALDVFFEWLMQQSFDNTGLAAFARASLTDSDTVLGTYPDLHNTSESTPEHTLFRRTLGYPLDRFNWRVDYNSLPALPTRDGLIGLEVAVALILTGGLLLLYRTASSQVILSQKRQDFVSAVTHELKTPLTSIRLAAEMLKEGWIGDEHKRREYYSTIANEGERLSRLINNVLQLARLEKGTARFELVTADPHRVFREMAREMEALASARGFSFRVDEQPDLPAVRFDADALKQVCFTLLDNSLKFSHTASVKEIVFSLKRKGNGVAFALSDRGPGIPVNELTRVFETFYRVESELTRKTKGTGIGLAMAKMMVEGMGGEIRAENSKDGAGLEVGILL